MGFYVIRIVGKKAALVAPVWRKFAETIKMSINDICTNVLV